MSDVRYSRLRTYIVQRYIIMTLCTTIMLSLESKSQFSKLHLEAIIILTQYRHFEIYNALANDI